MIVATVGAVFTNETRKQFVQASFYAESFELTEPARTAINDFYQASTRFPSGNSDLGIASPNSIYGSSVKRVFVASEGRVIADFGDYPGEKFLVFKPVFADGQNGSAQGTLGWDCFSDTIEAGVLARLQPSCFFQDAQVWKQQLQQAAAADFVSKELSGQSLVDSKRQPKLESLYAKLNFSADNCHAMRLSTLLTEQGDLEMGHMVAGAPITSHIVKPSCVEVLGNFVKTRSSYVDALAASLYGAISDCDEQQLATMVTNNPRNAPRLIQQNALLTHAVSVGCVAAVKQLARQESERAHGTIGLVDAMTEMPAQHFVRMTATLIELGVDVDQRAADGQSALAEAILREQPVAAVLLLDAGADASASTVNNSFPLIEASKKGYTHLSKRLLTAGADINATDAQGRTALLAAVVSGHTRIVDLLLRAGADRYIRDVNGIDAMTLAQSGDLDKIINLLKVNYASN